MADSSSAASSAASAASAAAKKYKKLDQREHVLLRPGMYIGSTEPDHIRTWVHAPAASEKLEKFEKFEKREIEYIPGLYKIFDEILVNSLDQITRLKLQKDPVVQHHVKSIKIEINSETGVIAVENDGDGIVIVKHPDEDIYIPEMIFGHLLTGSNYNDKEERIIGGQNGIGAKACNIFSKTFTITTVDARQGKKYVQTFRDNMSIRDAPKITSYSKKPFTRIEFLPDYKRFHCTTLSPDMYTLFLRRCYDVCALTDKDVSVTVNSQKLSIKSFDKYVDLYLGDDGQKRAHEIVMTSAGPWEIAATFNDSASFEQVSFVNGVSTLKGGRHVEYLSSMIVAHLSDAISKKRKDMDVKPALIKSHLFLFVKAIVPNPVFDGQSKETLTTPYAKFGTGKLELSDKFYSVLMKSGILERVVQLSEAGQLKDLKKLDGKVSQRITGIVKLDDANWAGGPKRSQCTLILTEGDSAKSMAISGISVVGKDKYGVYPLRGKVMNVKDVPIKKMMENNEINHIKTILGLEIGKKYTSPGELRYGRVMIMTDQDVDGSHIKGLLFNLFETLWPELVRMDGFLTSMLTPIIKISKGKAATQAFYTLQEYDAWKKSVGPAMAKAFSVKYYKGLGTSTANEAKEYFRDPKIVTYGCGNDEASCKEALDMVFNGKRADDRKAWLKKYDKDSTLQYGSETKVPYVDFVNKDFIHFSMYDVSRSIPHIQDGLKTSQRKIMFTCFSSAWPKEIKVFMLSARVAETAAYHHGETSLQDAIVGLARDYVGSTNNINLLDPVGQFGTRRMGGNDAASSRYICTRPMPVTDLIFRPEDRPILNYLEDDGVIVEPDFYVPIIPMVLVNGATGIGTGFSTSIPCYNPMEIIRALKADDMKAFDHMMPWYRGFKGKVTISNTAKADGKSIQGIRYTTTGIAERTGPKTMRISELPIGVWTDSFKELLEAKLALPNSTLQKYDVQYTDSDSFEFILTFKSEADIKMLSFFEDFKVTSPLGATSNMHLFNRHGQMTRYADICAIAEEFASVRLEYYTKRKTFMLAKIKSENIVLENKARFIEEVVSNKLIIGRRSIDQVNADLVSRSYVKVDDSYRYLLEMHIMSLTLERKAKLDAEIAANKQLMEYYMKTPERTIWIKELTELEAALGKYI